MAAPTPPLIPQAFANNAAAQYRNTIPNTTVSTQAASFNLGFPPLTMQPVIAGGKPPLGQDVNGILYMLSSHTFYQQSGQPYMFNAAVASAIGGYAVGTLLGSTDGFTVWYNTLANNSTNPDAGGAGWVSMYTYGITSVTGLTGGVRVLTAAEAARNTIILSGALIANVQVVVPNQIRRWLVVSNCTGGFSVTVKTAAGSGVNIPPAGNNAPVEVWSDGTNVYNVVAPVNLPIDQSPNPLTIAQRTNNGYLYATYFNQTSGGEAFNPAYIYCDTGDGFHRKNAFGTVQAYMNLASIGGQVTPGQVPVGAVNQWRGTILDNSNLTGTPTAPNRPPGDNTAAIANTAFVQNAIGTNVGLGVGQNWNITGKGKNVTYTNGARAIEVALSMGVQQGQNFQVYVNGNQIYGIGNGSSAANEIACSFIVPPFQTYYVLGSAGVSRWAELS